MRYYSKNKKRNIKFKIKHPKILIFTILICIIINLALYMFNKSIVPAVMKIAQEQLKMEANNIVNETALELYSKEFNYSDMIIIEKDNEGNITMLRADTVKLNYLSARLNLSANDKIARVQDKGLKVPLGYMTDNLVFYNLGPKMNIKFNQIGNITSNYESVFESAGINQTRHKIYLNVNIKMNVVVPLNSKEVDIVCQIPISETIIVGKIPNTAIELNKP